MLYILHIDGDKHVVRSSSSELRTAMREYIMREQTAGRKLADIEFSWAPLSVESLPALMKDYTND